MKRYQVYLHPHSVGILDDIASLSEELPRSRLIREVVEAAGDRAVNLVGMILKPKKNNYSELDKMIGSISIKGKKKVSLSQNVDDIYYR